MRIAFIERNPSLESCWRAIILQGRNTASYKFALAKSLLDIQVNNTNIDKKDLAIPFAHNLATRLKANPKQTVGRNEGKFISACKGFNAGEIDEDELQTITAREGFKYVLDAFHTVARDEVPFRFFEAEKDSITLTDNFYNLLKSAQRQNLEFEVDARWRLWETAISLKINPSHLIVENDSINEALFIKSSDKRRIEVTSSRDALSGYQKGKCFYCNTDITIIQGLHNSCDVDHFFPESLKLPNINGVWNLVLACQKCNRWDKSDRVPNASLIERLYNRNNFYVASHHPLKETIINQTGSSEAERRNFIQHYYNMAVDIKIHIYNPTIVEESLL